LRSVLSSGCMLLSMLFPSTVSLRMRVPLHVSIGVRIGRHLMLILMRGALPYVLWYSYLACAPFPGGWIWGFSSRSSRIKR